MTLYQKAVACVRAHGQISISLIERDLRCGYAMAAKLAERVRAAGIA